LKFSRQNFVASIFGKNNCKKMNAVKSHIWANKRKIHYRLDGPGIESQCGQDLLHPSRPGLGPTQPPVQQAPGLFPADTASRAWH